MKPSTNESKRAVIYVRISKYRDDQTSTRTQQKECEEYCKAHGWEVVDVLVDEGRSAWKKDGKRPKLDRAMSIIESKRANIMLVWKLDRFARSIVHFHELLGRINRADGKFVSVTDHIDGNTTQGQIMMGLVAGFAQMESDIKSERSLAWHKDRIDEGVPNGGQRPYGYHQQVKGSLRIKEDEAKVLREAAIRILDGDSIRSTMKVLAPKSVMNDGLMTARGFRSALTNPTVAGLRRVDDGFVRGNWDAILPRDQWDAIRTLFADPDRRTSSSNQVAHLLSGIVQCGRCDRRMGVRSWKANPTERQPYVREGFRLTCPCGNTINEANTERLVMTKLWEVVTPTVWTQWRTTGLGWDEMKIDDFKRQRETIITLQLEGKINWQFAEDKLAEIDRNEAMAMGDEPLDIPDVDDIEGSWESLSIKDQRKVVRQAFESIVLHPSNGTRDPNKRIEVVAA